MSSRLDILKAEINALTEMENAIKQQRQTLEARARDLAYAELFKTPKPRVKVYPGELQDKKLHIDLSNPKEK